MGSPDKDKMMLPNGQLLTEVGSNICVHCGAVLTTEELDEGCCGEVPAKRVFVELDSDGRWPNPDTD